MTEKNANRVDLWILRGSESGEDREGNDMEMHPD